MRGDIKEQNKSNRNNNATYPENGRTGNGRTIRGTIYERPEI